MKHPTEPHAKRDFVIGGAVLPKPHRMTREGEIMQAVLLGAKHEHIRFDRRDRMTMTACVLAAIAAVVIIAVFGPAQ